jgi:hypothetical protein
VLDVALQDKGDKNVDEDEDGEAIEGEKIEAGPLGCRSHRPLHQDRVLSNHEENEHTHT